MSKKYLLILESTIGSFSLIGSSDTFSLELSSYNNINFELDDEIFVFCKDSKKITTLFSFKSKDKNKFLFQKIFEIENNISIDEIENLSFSIENANNENLVFIELTDLIFSKIKKLILESLNENFSSTSSSPITYKQIIFYGVPGCGKSYSINNQLKELGITEDNKSNRIARVVFHPEYTNADFVGQILPKSTPEGISYPFIAGAFTQILEKAYNDKNQNYALIIEEINRGNAAAIFGDLFQLLDRFENGESEKYNDYAYNEGWSSYCVNNDNIANYIMEQRKIKETEKFIENFSLNTGIRLPPNLSIFATMNTSDQNVFKLDNAFKRRWDLQMIPNEFDLTDEKQRNQCCADIEGFDFTWGEFRLAVNKLITEDSDSNSFSDKQLGTWFVKNNNGEISSEIFSNKVLEYLWDDVFNFETQKLFKKDYKTLASIIFDVKNGKGIEIFNDDFKTLIKNTSNEINETSEKDTSPNNTSLSRKGKRISFNDINLIEGTHLFMSYKNSDYECVILNDTAVSYEGKKYNTLTALTREITRQPYPPIVSGLWKCKKGDELVTLQSIQLGSVNATN